MNNNPKYNDATHSSLGAEFSTLNPASLRKSDVAKLDRLYDALTFATETSQRLYLPPALLHTLDAGTILLGEWLDRHFAPPP